VRIPSRASFRGGSTILWDRTPILANLDSIGVLSHSKRQGITLLEVVVSLVIFLFSLVAISSLSSLGNSRAMDARDYSKASLLCQTKLGELVTGIEPLSAQGATAFKDEPDWTYEIDVSDGVVDSLKNVRVTVKLDKEGRQVEVNLTQMILSPASRGSTLDKLTTSTSSGTGGNSP
jgi:general secretion pathway protein I